MRVSPCAIFVPFLACAALGFSKEKPNIIFVLADDVGDQAIGCYGGTSFATPRIDSLASEGMLFRHCYAMPRCHPTRTTLLSGMYPFRLRHPPWGSYPAQFEGSTVANQLRELGYATVVAGKVATHSAPGRSGPPAPAGF